MKYFLLLFLSLNICANAQSYRTKEQKTIRVINDASVSGHSDCQSALSIETIDEHYFHSFPDGYGELMEMESNDTKSKLYFSREHHTIWLKVHCLQSGLLGLKIVPEDSTADLDFILFKSEGKDDCHRIFKKFNRPERTNISKNKTGTKGVTSLSPAVENRFAAPGPGSHLSSALEVSKGDSLILVIDRFSGSNAGFQLFFNYYQIKIISGNIIDDEDLKGVEAEVSMEDATSGERLASTTSDSVDGSFELKVPIRRTKTNDIYSLNAEADSSFFSEILITKEELFNKAEPLDIVLPRLRTGKRLRLNNINFHGNSPIPYENSKPTFRRLLKVMQKNPELRILIEGHTNGCQQGRHFSQKLSDNRAKTVKNYLLNNSIKAERIETKGMSCKKMLYPNPKTSLEGRLNRRVEIKVLDF